MTEQEERKGARSRGNEEQAALGSQPDGGQGYEDKDEVLARGQISAHFDPSQEKFEARFQSRGKSTHPQPSSAVCLENWLEPLTGEKVENFPRVA